MAPCQLAPARPTGTRRRRRTGSPYLTDQRLISPSLPNLCRIVKYQTQFQQTLLRQALAR